MSVKIIGESLPNMPWQERPAGNHMPIWRYTENPLFPRNPFPGAARIYNSAVVTWGDHYKGVFRADTRNGIPHLFTGTSADGIHWEFDQKPIQFIDEDGSPFQPRYAYDPRLVKIEDTYYAIWCGDSHGPTIHLAKTTDFKTFVRLENPFLPYNRNSVLFPRKIGGKFLLLSRPSDTGHTPFGDIFVSESKDLHYWGNHRHVMSKNAKGWWQDLKIGGGPAPIETTEGWLMLYHGVNRSCNGYIYSVGVVILDIDEPSKVKYRCENFIMTPEEWYEERGMVDNVVFPCATLCDADTGRIAIYYGAADTYTGLAFTTVEELVRCAKEEHEEVSEDADLGRV